MLADGRVLGECSAGEVLGEGVLGKWSVRRMECWGSGVLGEWSAGEVEC